MGYLFIDSVGILSNILASGREIQVECDTCEMVRRFTQEDIAALAAKVGPDFNLVNRRCRCRLSSECWGWNRFFYCSGVYRPLFTPEQAMRWNSESYTARMGLPADSRGGK